MKNIKLFVLPIVFAASLTGVALAECNNSGYGTNNSCKTKKEGFVIEKRVSKSGPSDKKEKITGVKKGQTFTFYFKVKNDTYDKADVKFIDKLPAELERVSGDDLTKSFSMDSRSDKTFEMVVKVKDSEFDNKTNFEKCVVNKAYITKDEKEKDSSSATVCYGDGVATKLPQTGPESIVLGSGLASIALGLVIRRFNKR